MRRIQKTTVFPAALSAFAGGETTTSGHGLKVDPVRPFDFLVFADHAENLGIADFICRSDPICLANPVWKRWHDMNKAGKPRAVQGHRRRLL